MTVAQLLHALLSRAGLSVPAAAKAAGLAFTTLYQRLEGRSCLGTEALDRVARACGASDDERLALAVANAMERGRLDLPTNTTEAQVRSALLVLRGAE